MERDRAAAETDFETAAHLHRRIDKIQQVSNVRDPIVAPILEFNGVALTCLPGTATFRLWPMLRGLWQPPIEVNLTHRSAAAKSLDLHVRELLSQRLAIAREAGNRTEELAVFSRWYYSSSRDGEWFAFRDLAALNYRKLVREISKASRNPV
jgi:hypothetical protein